MQLPNTTAEEEQIFFRRMKDLKNTGQLAEAFKQYENYYANELTAEEIEYWNKNIWGSYGYFLKSSYWRRKRDEKYSTVKDYYKCSNCEIKHGLQLHHKSYSQPWGLEELKDLEYLCSPCHTAEHESEELNRIFNSL